MTATSGSSFVAGPAGDVELRAVLDAADEGEALRAAVGSSEPVATPRRAGQERHAVRAGDRQPRHGLDRDARSGARRRSPTGGPPGCRPSAPAPTTTVSCVGRARLRLVRRGLAADDLGELGGGGRRVGDVGGRRDDRVAAARRAPCRPRRRRPRGPCSLARVRVDDRDRVARGGRAATCVPSSNVARRVIGPSSVATELGLDDLVGRRRRGSRPSIVAASSASSSPRVGPHEQPDRGPRRRRPRSRPATLQRRDLACASGGRSPDSAVPVDDPHPVARRGRSLETASGRRGSMAASRTGTPRSLVAGDVVAGEQHDARRPSRTSRGAGASTRRCSARCRSASPAGTRSPSARGRPRRSASGRARRAGTCAGPSRRRRARRGSTGRAGRAGRRPSSRAGATGRGGSASRRSAPQPGDRPHLRPGRAVEPGRDAAASPAAGRAGRGGPAGDAPAPRRGRRRARRASRARRAPARRSWPSAVAGAARARPRAPPRASAGRAGRSWANAHRNTAGVEQRDQGHAGLGADRVADPEPVPDARVVRVDRRQDDVHVQERRHGRDDVRDPPAPRERERDRREGEQREQVALVDPRRDGEEGEREDRHADEDREPVGPPGDEQRHDHEQQQAEQQRRRRRRPGTGRSTPTRSRRRRARRRSRPPLVAMLWPSTGNRAHRLYALTVTYE